MEVQNIRCLIILINEKQMLPNMKDVSFDNVSTWYQPTNQLEDMKCIQVLEWKIHKL